MEKAIGHTIHDADMMPCRLCRAGLFRIQPMEMPWLGEAGVGEPKYWEVRHWCEPVEGEGKRTSMTVVGQTKELAISRWNRLSSAS